MIDISKITDYLYVGSRIGHEHVDEIKLLKFDLIISMIGQLAPDEVYTLPPFKTLWIRAYDTPLTPISTRKLLMGIEAARPVILNEGKVLVFCLQGRRRSVTMAAAILISLGHSSVATTELLMKGREIADPRRFYVRWRIKAFERYWLRHGSPEAHKAQEASHHS